MTIQIVTDSTSDIPQSLIDSLSILVVPLYITINGKSYQDTVDLTREEFYQMLPDSDPHPTTAAPSPNQFIQVYDRAVDNGATAIFSIHVSKTFSATCASAEAAAREYKRAPVYVIDSGNLSLAEGLIVIKAAQAAKEGKTVEEVKGIIQSTIEKTFAYAKLDTIDYLLKGGRMNSIQHSIVSILGIKPILKMNNHVSRMEIARTKNKAFEKVLRTACDHFPDAELFGITHANALEQVEELIRELKAAIPDLPDPMISEANPALGVHVGPGTVCVNWIEGETHQDRAKSGLQKLFAYISNEIKQQIGSGGEK